MASVSSPSDLLPRIIHAVASAIERRNTGLNRHWLDVRNNIIDLVTSTIGLGMFSIFDHIILWEAMLIHLPRSIHSYRRRIAVYRHVRAHYETLTGTGPILILPDSSRKWRDGVTALILITVLPDCLSQFTVWLAILSRLAQTYSLMRASILDIGFLAERISTCSNNPQCDKTMAYADWNSKPEYTANGCVGTALIASDVSTPPYTFRCSCGIHLHGHIL